ncbi:methyltransferase domain-containing protein [Amycolatopsis sp. NBC_01307]|uniref:methyltransferase domain-containing protein n=1 Tax=Amycolatopsis sp. NBC_01307 TaxID=2903561 RepID=UPI002E164F2B|nr:methyltransferase domain-containing protein [Amycolatopsis sp. NBC_01307]
MTGTETPATPQRIVDVAVGYMAAGQLFAANRIGLFRALAPGPLDAAELAERTGRPENITRILGDALSSLGLLSRVDGRYALTPDTAAYLGGTGEEPDLAPFLTFLETISYPHWQQFPHTADTGEPGELDLTGDRWTTFIGGVMVYNALHARALVRAFDFGSAKRLLDLGGLSAAFALEALRANDVLHTTFVYDPRSVPSVTEAVAEFADRTRIVGAPTPEAEPDGEYDLVMVNHVLHRFGVEENRAILRHARAAAAPGARLLLLDFFLDGDAVPRSLDALHAGEYLVIDGTVVYPEADVRSWLADAGWRPVDRLTLPGSPRVLVAEAV